MKNLKRFRKDTGIKQVELAKMLNVSVQTVSLWENGKQSMDVKRLEAVCEILNCTPNDLMGWKTSTPSATPEDEALLRDIQRLDPASRAMVEAAVAAASPAPAKNNKVV